ncbi:arginine--tRNA ligase [Candidatus Pacearchaeota archaeon]|nr:arginine--tRNA ligase [Candidatus Pacearchaeota archaeon]
MKELVIKILKKALKEKDIKLRDKEIEKLIKIPPSFEMGDYAFPCFSFASQLKQDPVQIALEIREKIGNPPLDFDDIQTSGPYINFFVGKKELARKVIWESITYKNKFGRGKIGKKKKILVEFSSPNIAKPFGIGHLRSTIIGNSIANICEFQGFKVIRMNYFGDWGTQCGKLIFGFEKFGDEKKLHENPIKHLFDIYVKVSKNKKYDKEARKWFKKLEEKDMKAVMLWRAFTEFSLEDFKKRYKELGIKFDVYSGESEYNKKMKETIIELKEKKLLKKSKKALIVDLKESGLDVFLIQKSDGATLYSTRDLTSAIDRYKKYKFDRMIYEVGQEQKFYFKQLFKVLELMGYGWVKNCVHVDHGLYLDKDGKRFATRKGKTIFMKDIIEKTKSLAEKEIKKRLPRINKIELEKRAMKITIAAIFYGDLKNKRSNDMVFDLKRFVSFEGDTGPYIQYSYARATSILQKTKNKEKLEIPELEPKEIELVRKLSDFPKITLKAYESLNPSLIANYSYQLAQLFNEFYHLCPVIGSKHESFRLALIESFRQVIKNSLNLLGIDPLEEM